MIMCFHSSLKKVMIWSLIFAGKYSKGTLNKRHTDFTLKALPDVIEYNDSSEEK